LFIAGTINAIERSPSFKAFKKRNGPVRVAQGDRTLDDVRQTIPGDGQLELLELERRRLEAENSGAGAACPGCEQRVDPEVRAGIDEDLAVLEESSHDRAIHILEIVLGPESPAEQIAAHVRKHPVFGPYFEDVAGIDGVADLQSQALAETRECH